MCDTGSQAKMDVGGLEAIVHNLDYQKRELTGQVYFFFLEAAREQPFVQPNPPEARNVA